MQVNKDNRETTSCYFNNGFNMKEENIMKSTCFLAIVFTLHFTRFLKMNGNVFSITYLHCKSHMRSSWHSCIVRFLASSLNGYGNLGNSNSQGLEVHIYNIIMTDSTVGLPLLSLHLWFCFLWLQLPMVNHGLKILNGKFQKERIQKFYIACCAE